MNNFRIQQQTEAEKDTFLIKCFHNPGFVERIIENNYSIVAGRKGAGKTAIAKYLEKKSREYNIDLVYRISIREVFSSDKTDSNSILFFLIIKTIQYLLSQNIFSESEKIKKYWIDFLTQNGLQNITNYESFVESKKSHKAGYSLTGILNYLGLAKTEALVDLQDDSEYSKAVISNSPSFLITNLKKSIPKDKSFLIFIDDLSDHLDDKNETAIKKSIDIIKDILFHLSFYNSELMDFGLKCRFISLLRDDLFEFMDGSNINKLRSDTFMLRWDEKGFASLLIKRLPFYQDNLEKYLVDPIESLRKQFPDEIFTKILNNFNTKRYSTNFYAYIVAISFNRPRDFLKFCYAMRDRLSLKHPVEIENIESAEIEYSDYFTQELKDELFIASKIIKFEADYDGLNRLVDLLSQRNGFNVSQLRTGLGQYLGEKTSIGRKKIEYLIYELWWYGIIGFQNRQVQKNIIHYRYISNSIPLTKERIKEYLFFLHRGLWWFM